MDDSNNAQTPRIKHFSWGRIEIEGYPPYKDAKVYPGGAREWDWGETGTNHSPGIQPADVEELIDNGAEVIVLSRGAYGRLRTSPETLEMLDLLKPNRGDVPEKLTNPMVQLAPNVAISRSSWSIASFSVSQERPHQPPRVSQFLRNVPLSPRSEARRCPMHVNLVKVTAVSALVSLLLSSCSESDEGPPAEFRAATFNVGLAPIDVAYAAERAPVVVEALGAAEVDLICVQEFWLEADWSALAEATSTKWPNTVRLPAEPVEALCTLSELEPLQLCVEDACPGAAGDDLADCAIASCAVEVAALSPGCAGCLIDEVEAGADIEGLRATCLGGGDSGDVEAFIYDGAYDTGILTSAAILVQESLVLDSYLYRASVDYALVDSPVGELHVFCTHLASAVPQFEYRGDFGSWEGEQARQVEQLLDFVEQKTGGSAPAIVLGDLNTGPAIADHDIAPQWPDHYDEVVGSGFSNPLAESSAVVCTDCPDNTFHSPDSDATLIDHILLRDFDGQATTERFMTGVVTIRVEGQDVVTNISDHYGLVMTLGGGAN